jgi:hypothetical protein
MRSRAHACLTFTLLALVAGATLIPRPSAAQGSYYRKGTFAMGGGINTPVGETNPYLNSSGSIFFAGGRNINQRWAVEVEYTHNWLAIDQAVIDRATTDSSQVQDAHASMWSTTLNLIYRFRENSDIVPWVTAGGGYYKRNIQLTTSALVYYPPIWDPWWGWIDGGWTTGEAIVGQHATAAFGVNGGFGVDMGIENGAVLFIEARYHYALMDGVKMQIIPVMAGFRW